MAALAVALELTNIPLSNERNDDPTVRIVDPRLLKCHIAKMPNV